MTVNAKTPPKQRGAPAGRPRALTDPRATLSRSSNGRQRPPEGLVECACGCGTWFYPRDTGGSPQRYYTEYTNDQRHKYRAYRNRRNEQRGTHEHRNGNG